MTIALDASGLHATDAASDGPTTTVELVDAAGTSSTLEVTQDRRKLTVTSP